MAEFLRRQIMIPDRVYNTLRRYDPLVAWEVFEAIRVYAHYWDVHRSDDGFDLAALSADAKAVFLSIYDELYECNSAYFERCALARQAAVEKNRQDKQRKQTRERVKKYRQKNKKCNAKSADNRQKSVTVTQCNAKNGQAQNSAQNQSVYSVAAKSVTLDKNGNYTKKALQNFPQSQSQQGIAENCAGYKDYCNTSLHSVLQDYWKGGMWENQVMHKLGAPARPERSRVLGEAGGAEMTSYASLAGGSNQTSGLSCSKAVPGIRDPEPIMPGSRSAAGSKADDREGSKPAVKGSEEIVGNKGRLSSNDSEVISSKRLDAAVRPTAGISKVEVPPLPSAPHKPAAHEVLITKGFKIDLTDEFFYPYRRADGFLLRGVENWLAANKRGCSVEKRWICKQIYKFAERQGKLEQLLGVSD